MKIEGIPPHIPPVRPFDTGVNHAPVRKDLLTKEEKKLALANALRYFPPALHELLAPEFASELREYGRIYMYRYRPADPITAGSIDDYPAKCRQAAAIMLSQ